MTVKEIVSEDLEVKNDSTEDDWEHAICLLCNDCVPEGLLDLFDIFGCRTPEKIHVTHCGKTGTIAGLIGSGNYLGRCPMCLMMMDKVIADGGKCPRCGRGGK